MYLYVFVFVYVHVHVHVYVYVDVYVYMSVCVCQPIYQVYSLCIPRFSGEVGIIFHGCELQPSALPS